MILEPFWALFECDGRTDARTDGGQVGPARPAPRAWISSRVRAAPPHSNIEFTVWAPPAGGEPLYTKEFTTDFPPVYKGIHYMLSSSPYIQKYHYTHFA